MIQSKKVKIKIHDRDQSPKITKLDITKLGRPYYKVPEIILDYFDLLEAQISLYFLKKYRINLSLKNIQIETNCSHKNIKIFNTQLGHVAFDIERDLLLSILNDYYGLIKDSITIESTTPLPTTKTEERLGNKLGLELTELFLNQNDFGEPLALKSISSIFIKQWSYRIIFLLEGDKQHSFSIFLDTNHIDRVLHSKHPGVENKQKMIEKISSIQLEKMFNKLPITLSSKVTTINITLAELMALKKGEIISTSLPECFPVFIGAEQIFSAVIAESRGKLFLSEFNEKTNEITQ